LLIAPLLALLACAPDPQLDTAWNGSDISARCAAGESISQDFAEPPSPDWRLDGDAVWVPGGVVLTNARQQAGVVWWRSPVQSDAWRVAATFEVSAGDHADGIALAIHSDLDPRAVGMGGGSLGCNGLDALCIGLKTHQWERLRVFHGSDGAPLLPEVPVALDLGVHELRAQYDAPQLRVFLDGEALVDMPWPEGTPKLGSEVLLGVTGATGARWDRQVLRAATVGCR